MEQKDENRKDDNDLRTDHRRKNDCADIKKGWRQVARRLQEFSSHARGRTKFVSITIAVDDTNNPIFWYEPTMRRIEPKMNRETLLSILVNMEGEDGAENL